MSVIYRYRSARPDSGPLAQPCRKGCNEITRRSWKGGWKRANKWLRFNCQAQKGVEVAESSHRFRGEGKGNAGEDRISLPGSITKIECSLTCQWAQQTAHVRYRHRIILYRSWHVKSGSGSSRTSFTVISMYGNARHHCTLYIFFMVARERS